jgi:hypothetical protein
MMPRRVGAFSCWARPIEFRTSAFKPSVLPSHPQLRVIAYADRKRKKPAGRDARRADLQPEA